VLLCYSLLLLLQQYTSIKVKAVVGSSLNRHDLEAAGVASADVIMLLQTSEDGRCGFRSSQGVYNGVLRDTASLATLALLNQVFTDDR
jgi:hypothetical protein